MSKRKRNCLWCVEPENAQNMARDDWEEFDNLPTNQTFCIKHIRRAEKIALSLVVKYNVSFIIQNRRGRKRRVGKNKGKVRYYLIRPQGG